VRKVRLGLDKDGRGRHHLEGTSVSTTERAGGDGMKDLVMRGYIDCWSISPILPIYVPACLDPLRD
jgi:hypothetical protein